MIILLDASNLLTTIVTLMLDANVYVAQFLLTGESNNFNYITLFR